MSTEKATTVEDQEARFNRLNPKTLPWEIGNITKANIRQLKAINISTLPVRYSDKFYDELLDRYDNKYLQYAFCNGFSIGAICARVETEENLPFKKLYVMTLNVLAPYRRYGVGKYSPIDISAFFLYLRLFISIRFVE